MALAEDDDMVEALVGLSRQVSPHIHCQKQSTALVSLDRTQTFLIAHVFHPLYGRELQLIDQYLAWGEDRGARSTWTIRDRSDAIDRRHVAAQESARRGGASSIIPPPSGRIGAALSRLIVAGRRACTWSAMAAPGRSAPARQSIGCRSQSGELPRPCARAEAMIS